MPVAFYPPSARPHRSFARIVFTTLASIIFGFSLLLNLYLLTWLGISKGGPSTSNTLVKGSATEEIAVVPIDGMLMSGSVSNFERLISQVEANDAVRAVVIEVDTPGGGVTASDELHHRIVKFKQNMQAKGRTVPVIISMKSLATSGGYYLACAGDHIFAQPTTMTGNIGVMMSRFNLSKFAQEWGIEDSSLHSTGSDFKTAGSMWRAETPEEQQYIQGLVDGAFTQFKDVVVAGRGGKLTAPIARIASGKVYLAAEAKDLGLIDDIKYPDEVYQFAANLVQVSNPTVKRYDLPPSLLDLLGVESSMPGRSAQNGLQVKIDRSLVEEFARPKLMYMWQGQ